MELLFKIGAIYMTAILLSLPLFISNKRREGAWQRMSVGAKVSLVKGEQAEV